MATTAPPRPAGRPPKIANSLRWQLYVDANVRAEVAARAEREGLDLPDAVRALMAAYAAGQIGLPA